MVALTNTNCTPDTNGSGFDWGSTANGSGVDWGSTANGSGVDWGSIAGAMVESKIGI